MGWGRVDYRQLKDFQRKLEKLEAADTEAFIENAAKELAARLLGKVIRRTPVGVYDDGTVGGTLRRGWTSKTQAEAEAGGNVGVKRFVDGMHVSKSGSTYEVEIVNPVNYAMYVEFGHRTRDHKKWVEGRFMLTISEQELEAQAPAILEKKLKKYLGEALL